MKVLNLLCNNSLGPLISTINYEYNNKSLASCLTQDKVIFTHKQVVNITSYLRDKSENSLSRAVKFTKNTNPDKYKHSGYGNGFDARGGFLLSNGSGFGKNIMIFDADMSLLVHIDNKKKDILIIGKGAGQWFRWY